MLSGKGSYKSRFRRLRGRGSYTAGTSVRERTASMPLSFSGSGRSNVRVRHSEYLGDVITSGTPGAFLNDGMWVLNPGNKDTFPWLSAIAGNFEEFQFNGLVFQFKSTSVDALVSNNTALGVVIGATDYNVMHNAFPNKAVMDNYEFTVSGKPSLSWTYPVECNPKMNVLKNMYITSQYPDTLAAREDPKMYFLGGFQIATSGFQGTSVNVGELWVTYDVSLFKPSLLGGGGGIPPGNVPRINFFHISTVWSPTSTAPKLTGVDGSHLFGTQTAATFQWPGDSAGPRNSALWGGESNTGTGPLAYPCGNFGFIAFSPTGNTITIPAVTPGYLYMVGINWAQSANSTGSAPSLGNTSGCSTFPWIVPTVNGGWSSSAFGSIALGTDQTQNWASCRLFQANSSSGAPVVITASGLSGWIGATQTAIDAFVLEIPFTNIRVGIH